MKFSRNNVMKIIFCFFLIFISISSYSQIFNYTHYSFIGKNDEIIRKNIDNDSLVIDQKHKKVSLSLLKFSEKYFRSYKEGDFYFYEFENGSLLMITKDYSYAKFDLNNYSIAFYGFKKR
jgi:hypothetical protein